MSIPVGVVSLGEGVIAEHPNGHRVVGHVIGCGTNGVILDSRPLFAGFLSFADGWTVVRAESQPAADPRSADEGGYVTNDQGRDTPNADC